MKKLTAIVILLFYICINSFSIEAIYSYKSNKIDSDIRILAENLPLINF